MRTLLNRMTFASIAVCCLPLARLGFSQPLPMAVVSPEVSRDRIVTFRLLAPNAKEVSVIGEFSRNATAMTKDEKGVWSVTVARSGLMSTATGSQWMVSTCRIPATRLSGRAAWQTRARWRYPAMRPHSWRYATCRTEPFTTTGITRSSSTLVAASLFTRLRVARGATKRPIPCSTCCTEWAMTSVSGHR